MEPCACTGSFQCDSAAACERERGGDAKPKMNGRCILRTACSKRPMHRMKLDVINGEHQSLIFTAWRLVLSMTSKRIVLPETVAVRTGEKMALNGRVFTLDPYHRGSWCYDVVSDGFSVPIIPHEGEKWKRSNKKHVLDRYSPFDRTEREPFSTWEHSNRSRLPFHR